MKKLYFLVGALLLAGASFAATVNGAQVVDLWGGVRADGSAWSDDTMCFIASGTKGICAVAVLMCVERGKPTDS